MIRKYALYTAITLSAAVFLPSLAHSCIGTASTTDGYRSVYPASCENAAPEETALNGAAGFSPCAVKEGAKKTQDSAAEEQAYADKDTEISAVADEQADSEADAAPEENTETENEDGLASVPDIELPNDAQEETGPSLTLAFNNTIRYDACKVKDTAADEETDGSGIPIILNRKVTQYIKYFQGRGRKHFERWLGRSGEYMAMLQKILREENMPEDLSYIAFIESGLNPKAKSRAKAVGMWQFIKGTGRKYGLRIDLWVDERMDPEKATYAAASYFRDLYDIFGSWYLAAAGYNAGEGRIIRAVKKLGTEDFWEISSHKRPLKKETRDYVPKYLAALIIAKDPASYGFEEQELRGVVEYDKVVIPEATDLRVIAEAADTTTEEIRRLNPELLRWFTPPGQNDYEVKIPKGSRAVFETRFAEVPRTERLNFRMHTVRKGETLSSIARRYNANLKSMLYINNFKNAGRVRAGTVIAVPVPAYTASNENINGPKKNSKGKVRRVKGHNVAKKDNSEA